VDRDHLVALANQVPVDLLKIGHCRLGGGRRQALGLQAEVELVRLDIHAVLEGLVVHHHVAGYDRDLMFLNQV